MLKNAMNRMFHEGEGTSGGTATAAAPKNGNGGGGSTPQGFNVIYKDKKFSTPEELTQYLADHDAKLTEAMSLQQDMKDLMSGEFDESKMRRVYKAYGGYTDKQINDIIAAQKAKIAAASEGVTNVEPDDDDEPDDDAAPPRLRSFKDLPPDVLQWTNKATETINKLSKTVDSLAAQLKDSNTSRSGSIVRDDPVIAKFHANGSKSQKDLIASQINNHPLVKKAGETGGYLSPSDTEKVAQDVRSFCTSAWGSPDALGRAGAAPIVGSEATVTSPGYTAEQLADVDPKKFIPPTGTNEAKEATDRLLFATHARIRAREAAAAK